MADPNIIIGVPEYPTTGIRSLGTGEKLNQANLARAFTDVANGLEYVKQQGEAADDTVKQTLFAAKAAATGNVASLTGSATLDGVLCSGGDRVFLPNQTNKAQNGPYIVGTPWSRPSDFNSSAKIKTGQRIPVTFGATWGGREFQLSSPGPFVLESTDLVWDPVGGGGAGAGTIQPVHAVASSNVSLSAPGAVIGGVTMDSNHNRVLLPVQTAAAENGVYLWAGASTPLTRTADCDSDSDLRVGQQIRVLSDGTIWELNSGSTLAGSKTYKQLTNATDKPNHDVLWDYEIQVGRASGDATGATDSANIAAAIARAGTLANIIRPGLKMRLAFGVGHYYINAPITQLLLVGFKLVGVGPRCTTIEYVGARVAGRAMLEADSCINCEWENIEFIGNRVERMVRSVFAPGQPTGNVFRKCHFYGINPYDGSSAVIGTSTDTVTVGSGSKSFTVTPGAGVNLSDVLINGSKVGAFSRSTGKFVWGTITSATGSASLVFTVANVRQRDFRGSGSANDWDIAIPPEGMYLTDAGSITEHCWFSRLFYGWFADGCFNSQALNNWFDPNSIFGWAYLLGTSSSHCHVRGSSEWSTYGWSNFCFAGASFQCTIEHNTGDGGIEGECIRADFAVTLTIRGDFWVGGISGTSTSSVPIGTGPKSFTIQAGHYLPTGTPINFVSGANAMSGTVTTYNRSTGAVVINSTSTSGSGTYASWTWDARPNRSAAIVANGTEQLDAKHCFYSHDCFIDFDDPATGGATNIDPWAYHLKRFGGATAFWKGGTGCIAGDDYRIQDNATGRTWYAKIKHDEATIAFLTGCNTAEITELKTGTVPASGASASRGIWSDGAGNRFFGAQYQVPVVGTVATGVNVDVNSLGGIVKLTGAGGAFSLSGFLQGYEGHQFITLNTTGQVCTFKHEDVTETIAQRRLSLPGGVDLVDDGAGVCLWIYKSDSRFHPIPLRGFSPTAGALHTTKTYVDGLTFLSVGAGASLLKSGGTLTRAALTGDVTASADSNTTTIAANAVTTAKIADANVTSAKLSAAINTSINNAHVYEWMNQGSPATSAAPWISKVTNASGSTVRSVSERLVAGDFTATYFAFSCSNALATDSFTATVYKNGVATALTFTVANGVASGSDTAHSVSFSRGDKIAINCTQTGTENVTNWFGEFVVAGG